MGKLNIQVNGHGMIPRGYGIAPRKEPFPVTDLYFISLILNTPGLSVKFVNPESNKLENITKNNLKKIWDKYSNYNPDTKKPVIQQTNDIHQNTNEVISSPVTNKQSTAEQSNDTSNIEDENLSDTNTLDKNNNSTHQDNNKNVKNNKKHY